MFGRAAEQAMGDETPTISVVQYDHIFFLLFFRMAKKSSSPTPLTWRKQKSRKTLPHSLYQLS